ncbi:hypothetical protein [Acinetobacter lwoffii]|jgi:predicted transcriptional regulator of viral defense system|uniref:hypothetical protein n=1 Tax=Acinetobacter lwoffii TaxID=28090 RepID=UPI003F92BC3A
MKIDEAFETWLFQEYEYVSASWQTLYLGFLKIWTEKKYNAEQVLGIASNAIPINKFKKIINILLINKSLRGFYTTDKDYMFFIKNPKKLNKNQNLNPEKILSGVFPYSYISHLSAMKLYGLTQIQPSAIYITVPIRQIWKEYCLKDLQENFFFTEKENSFTLNDDYYYEAPTLKLNGKYVKKNQIITTYPFDKIFHDIFPDQNIIIVTKKVLDDSEWWSGYHIQNISSLYLDMIKFPHYCGGLVHVIEVMKNSLDKNIFSQILEKIENEGSEIDKARFGFICEKLLDKKNSLIDRWKIDQQGKRGSSRKLIASADFDPVFDPEWNISINHEEIKKTFLVGAMAIKTPLFT